MKHFLHWSCAVVLGVMGAFAFRAYGVVGWALFMVCGMYVMVAQWCEGRYCK